MILSVSRRTDIPAFYSEWFINRLREGYVLIPNPYNPNQLSRISLSPQKIDCIVFWTKNALPLLRKLDVIEDLGYKDYYFEFTITAYDDKVEKYLPQKENVIEVFQRLSDRVGTNRVDWRFDPIIINKQFTESWILNRFEQLCKSLAGYTNKCIISFIDIYRHIRPNFTEIPLTVKENIVENLVNIASAYNLKLYMCSENQDYSSYGLYHSTCIDKEKIESIIGCKLNARKDIGQRKNCGCIESIDIGVYNTCKHGCSYCYATEYSTISRNEEMQYNPCYPILTGYPTGKENITNKKTVSLKDYQYSMDCFKEI